MPMHDPVQGSYNLLRCVADCIEHSAMSDLIHVSSYLAVGVLAHRYKNTMGRTGPCSHEFVIDVCVYMCCVDVGTASPPSCLG